MAQTTNPGPFFHRVPRAHPAAQPFTYPLQRVWAVRDWRRLPGFGEVTRTVWVTAEEEARLVARAVERRALHWHQSMRREGR